jgi:hypothetical protein
MTCRTPVLVLAYACAALSAAPAAAQDKQAPQGKVRVPPHGVQGFTRLLHAVKLRPLASIEELRKADPKDTVVILFGNPAPLDQMEKAGLGVADFVDQGGSLLVATDHRTGGMLADFEVQVVGDVITQEGPRNAKYKGQREFPLITRVAKDHPVFRGVQQLATISPSQVIPMGQRLFLSRLAQFSDGWQSNQRFFRDAAFIDGTDAANSRHILVIGGHSVFMNVLLASGDNDNFGFALNTVRCLTDGGRRKHCLFLYDGSVAANYDVPLGGVPVPTEELINKMFARMEKEGFFERLAETMLPVHAAPYLLLYGTSLFLAIYLFLRVWSRRHEVPREAPLLSAKVAQTVPEETVLALRQQALVHEDNLWEVARSLARQCFERHGQGAEGTPVVIVTGPRGQHLERRRRVLALWKLARGKPGRVVRARDFARVLADIEAVDEWLADGAVRLEFPSRPENSQLGRGSPKVSMS